MSSFKQSIDGCLLVHLGAKDRSADSNVIRPVELAAAVQTVCVKL
jgi:hypothetical protein